MGFNLAFKGLTKLSAIQVRVIACDVERLMKDELERILDESVVA
jgi:hypothetical protein